MVVEAVDLVGVAEGVAAVGAEYCAPVLGEEYSTSRIRIFCWTSLGLNLLQHLWLHRDLQPPTWRKVKSG